MAHIPEHATYLGPDAHGNHTFTVESDSSPGTWYSTTIFADGIGGVCDCPGYRTHGHCGMVDRPNDALKFAAVAVLVNALLDLSAGITYNAQETEGYELDAATIEQANALINLANTHVGH